VKWPRRIIVWTYDGGVGVQFRAMKGSRAAPDERVYVLEPVKKVKRVKR
jgi:hypothetical protein